MKTIKVQCSYIIEVEYPDDYNDDDLIFDIEENHCPGTGRVGSAFDKFREEMDKTSNCWACALFGENEIIS